MSCIGGKCPGLEEYHDFEYCLETCPVQCMPAAVIVQIRNKQRTDVHQGEYISATALVDSACARQMFLERRMDYYVEHAKNWWNIRGSLLHAILTNPDFQGLLDDMRRYYNRAVKDNHIENPEAAAVLWNQLLDTALKLNALLPKKNHIDDWESETQYQYSLGVINGKERILYGTIDVLRRNLGELLDYKTVGDRGISIIKAGAKNEHIQQVNIYKFLVERGHPVGVKSEDYIPPVIQKISLYYLSLMSIVKTGGLMIETSDYRVSEPEDKYLTREIIGTREELITKKGKRKDSINPNDKEIRIKTKYRMTYAIPEVPLTDLNEVEEFIRRKAAPLFDMFDKNEAPEMVSADVRQWKCNYCPDAIKFECDRICAERGEVREPKLVQVENGGIAIEA